MVGREVKVAGEDEDVEDVEDDEEVTEVDTSTMMQSRVFPTWRYQYGLALLGRIITSACSSCRSFTFGLFDPFRSFLRHLSCCKFRISRCC